MRISTPTAALVTLIVVVWMASHHVRSESLYIQDLGQSHASLAGGRSAAPGDSRTVDPARVGANKNEAG
jgi:hypothetical protein